MIGGELGRWRERVYHAPSLPSLDDLMGKQNRLLCSTPGVPPCECDDDDAGPESASGTCTSAVTRRSVIQLEGTEYGVRWTSVLSKKE